MFSRKFSNTIRRKKRLIISTIISIILILGIGYASFYSDFSINGLLDVSGYKQTLYNVLKKEANSGGLARKYTGEHADSMDSTKSTKDIYHWYATNNTEGDAIQEKNNVIFAGQCWRILRTTDTGGVKLIYNGAVTNNNCTNPNAYHVGYSYRTTHSLDSDYWYGTDYEFHPETGRFTLGGDVTHTVWSDTTYENLIGKYTIRKENETDDNHEVYLIESYKDSTTANVLLINSSRTSDGIGALMYNEDHQSLSDTGYMYGEIYEIKSASFLGSNIVQMFSTKNDTKSNTSNTSQWYADDVSYDSSTGKYSLVNPYQLSSTSDYSVLEGKYSFFNNDSTYTDSNVNYIISAQETSSSVYSLNLSGGKTASTVVMVVGDSITEGTNTCTINNPSQLTYSDLRSSVNTNKKIYACLGSSDTCAQPIYIKNFYFYGAYVYTNVNYKNKKMLGKNWNGTSITDTILVRNDEISKNYLNYQDYKYTCNSSSDTCSESSLKKIYNLSDSYYYLANFAYMASSVTWDGTEYTLQNPLEYDTNYNVSKNYRFYCLEPYKTKCSEIAYIVNPNSSYISFKNGITTLDEALADMMEKNIHDSSIKFGIDAWYKKYILPYDNYIEDTIYCNDRSILSLGSWDPSNNSSDEVRYNSFNLENDLSCTKETDKFSISNNKAKLTYKVGLATAPELNMMNNHNARLFPEEYTYWLNTAYNYIGRVYMRNIWGNDMGYNSCFYTEAVRPTISLKPNTEYSVGNGTKEKPYYIGNAHSITSNSNIFKIDSQSISGWHVTLESEDYVATSFKLNGTLVEGDSFTMPDEDVTITDITYVTADYNITCTDEFFTLPQKGRYNTTITLDSNEYRATSFKLNGNLIEGNSFVMPAEDVTITEITKTPIVIVESAHNPYPNSINKEIYYENTFTDATSITVELTYQTEHYWDDYVWLYDSSNGTPINDKRYGGKTLKTEIIEINSDYLKIVFNTDSSINDYYGFKAIIIPNYD